MTEAEEFKQFTEVMNNNGFIDMEPAVQAACEALSGIFAGAPVGFLRYVSGIVLTAGIPKIVNQIDGLDFSFHEADKPDEEDPHHEPPC